MKNNYLILAFKDDCYGYKDADIAEMAILGCFLISDVYCFGSKPKEWVLFDTQYTKYGANITFLEKKDGYIIVSDQYSEEPDGGPYFPIEQREFVKFLDEWENICKQNPKPQEVVITYDGKRFTFS